MAIEVDRRNLSGSTGRAPAEPGPHADLVIRVATHTSMDEPIAAALAPTVGTSWRRCLNEFNLDPTFDYQPTVLDLRHTKDLQAEHEELVQIARAEMDSLYEQIAGSGFALLLADTSGVILCEKIDPTLRRMFIQAGLIVGAEWGEQRASVLWPPSPPRSRSINRSIFVHDTSGCRVPRPPFTILMGVSSRSST